MSKQEEWDKNPENAAWLKSVLGSPLGRFFMDVMEERSELRLNVNLPPAFLTANGAAMSGRVLGYERCLQNIRDLASPNDVKPTPLQSNFGVNGPEDATE
jgi:hypothetical protein